MAKVKKKHMLTVVGVEYGTALRRCICGVLNSKEGHQRNHPQDLRLFMISTNTAAKKDWRTLNEWVRRKESPRCIVLHLMGYGLRCHVHLWGILVLYPQSPPHFPSTDRIETRVGKAITAY